MSSAAQSNGPREPRQARARATYEKLLMATGELLEEIGIESISTNAIVERAGVTPPAYYRYFSDKYDILKVLGNRLMEKQNTLILTIIEEQTEQDVFSISVHQIEKIISETVRTTEAFPGGPWITRSLRAIPSLLSIRTESHAAMAKAIADTTAPSLPNSTRAEVYRQSRLAIDLGYATMELIFDEPGLNRKAVIRDAALAISAFFVIVT